MNSTVPLKDERGPVGEGVNLDSPTCSAPLNGDVLRIEDFMATVRAVSAANSVQIRDGHKMMTEDVAKMFGLAL